MSEILQVLGILQFEKRPILELFTAFDSDIPEATSANQLLLFDIEPDTSDRDTENLKSIDHGPSSVCGSINQAVVRNGL